MNAEEEMNHEEHEGEKRKEHAGGERNAKRKVKRRFWRVYWFSVTLSFGVPE